MRNAARERAAFFVPGFSGGLGEGRGENSVVRMNCFFGGGRYPAVTKEFTGDSVPGPVPGFWEQAEQIGKRFLNLQPEKGL